MPWRSLLEDAVTEIGNVREQRGVGSRSVCAAIVGEQRVDVGPLGGAGPSRPHIHGLNLQGSL